MILYYRAVVRRANSKVIENPQTHTFEYPKDEQIISTSLSSVRVFIKSVLNSLDDGDTVEVYQVTETLVQSVQRD